MPRTKILLYLFTGLFLIFLVITPGLLGVIAKHYIERAVYLSNLNTALTIQLSEYQQSWFSSTFTIEIFTEDPYEEELIPIGKYPALLKHGPITLVNQRPGIGAFYLYSKNFEELSPTSAYIGYARAGFLGNVELNINVDLHALSNAYVPQQSPVAEHSLSPLILSLESDFTFEHVRYQILWPGMSQTVSSRNAQVGQVRFQGALERLDDQRWQGMSNVYVKSLSLPASDFELQDMKLTLSNKVVIEESNRRTVINTRMKASHIRSPWTNWNSPQLDLEIQNADLHALSNLYDLAEKAYLEFDSPFDEYAQLEYMAALQTTLPALFSDNAQMLIHRLSYLDNNTGEETQITGQINFPDLPEYMDEHLLSLIAKTNGQITSRSPQGEKVLTIKNGKITTEDNQPLNLSIFN